MNINTKVHEPRPYLTILGGIGKMHKWNDKFTGFLGFLGETGFSGFFWNFRRRENPEII